MALMFLTPRLALLHLGPICPYTFILRKKTHLYMVQLKSCYMIQTRPTKHMGTLSDRSKPINLFQGKKLLRLRRHDLMKQYNLNGQFRWMSAQMNRHVVVKFTATLLIREEHLCNLLSTKPALPTFAAGPYHPNQEGELMADFFECCKKNLATGIRSPLRGFSGFYYRNTWKIYSEGITTVADVFGFWKYVSKLERRETRQYLEMFYLLMFWDLGNSVPVVPEEQLAMVT